MVAPVILGGILSTVEQIADDLLTSDEERGKLAIRQRELDLQEREIDQRTDLAQIGANSEQAKSTNWFVSGGRPFVMWVCGLALAYATLFEPVARFVAQVGYGYSGPFPAIDTDLTLQILLGLLGLSGMRSFERFKGVIPPGR